ncbi:MAG: hypothetical protein AAF679_15535 [Pseudomonadota bacterium]
MNHEAQLIVLHRIEAAIRTELLTVDVNGPPKKGTASYDNILEKAAAWEKQLAGLEARAKSKMHGAAGRMNLLRGRSSAAWSAKQSAKSHMANGAQVRDGCLKITALLAELYWGLGGFGNAERSALEGLKSALNNLTKQDTGFELGSGPDTQAVVEVFQGVSGRDPSTPSFNPGASIDVFTLVLAMFTLFKALRQGKTHDIEKVGALRKRPTR